MHTIAQKGSASPPARRLRLAARRTAGGPQKSRRPRTAPQPARQVRRLAARPRRRRHTRRSRVQRRRPQQVAASAAAPRRRLEATRPGHPQQYGCVPGRLLQPAATQEAHGPGRSGTARGRTARPPGCPWPRPARRRPAAPAAPTRASVWRGRARAACAAGSRARCCAASAARPRRRPAPPAPRPPARPGTAAARPRHHCVCRVRVGHARVPAPFQYSLPLPTLTCRAGRTQCCRGRAASAAGTWDSRGMASHGVDHLRMSH